MIFKITNSPYSLDVYRDALGVLGWMPSLDPTEVDAIQETVRDTRGNIGILLRLNGMPGVFLRAAEAAMVDPLEVYEALVLGWNLEAWFTAVPAPHNLLRIYNTTYKPNKELIVRGEENSVAEINLSDVLDIESVQQLTGQLLLLSPDTWRSQNYQQFLKSSTGQRRLTVDNSLLRDLQNWRLTLVRNLHELYSDVPLFELDTVSQKILDEIIFIRFCEDRSLTKFDALYDLAVTSKRNEFIERFQELVNKYENLFDTSLFDHNLTKIYKPSQSVLQAIIVESVEFYKFDLLDVDLLGRIYEDYLSYELKDDIHGISYQFQLDQRRQQGVYYTPSYIVDYLVKRSFCVFQQTNERSVLSALDPACGSGIFLTSLFKEFLKQELGADIKKKRSILKDNIFGIDIDKRAVRRAAQALYYTLLTDEAALEGSHLLPELLEQNLLVKDSLLERKDFFGGKLFDIIVSNPPYRRISGEQLLVYKNHYADLISNQSDLCWLMLAASIDNLVDKGIVAFIVPDNLLRTSEYAKLRKFLLENTCIIEISYLNYQAFDSTSLQNIILILQKEQSYEKRVTNSIQVNYFITPGLFEAESSAMVEQSSFYNEEIGFVFNVQLTRSIHLLYEKIKGLSQKLSEYFNVSQGIKPDRNNLHDVPIQGNYKRYLFGKDIHPYLSTWSGKYINYDLDTLIKEPNTRLREPRFFETSVKLILRKIVGSRLVVALDFEKYYVDSASYILLPSPSLSADDIYVALAILSSRIVKFYYQVEYPERKTSFPQIRGMDIERLPFPILLLREETTIYNELLTFAKILYEKVKKGDINHSNIFESEESKEIDKSLMRLYRLSDEEVLLINTYLGL